MGGGDRVCILCLLEVFFNRLDDDNNKYANLDTGSGVHELLLEGAVCKEIRQRYVHCRLLLGVSLDTQHIFSKTLR